MIVLAFQGTRGIWEPDEGFYVSAASEMLAANELLVPTLNEQPFLDKPPLTYWGIVAGLRLFGQNEWGARFYHALTFLLTVALVARFSRELNARPMADLLAAMIYTTMLLPLGASNVVTPDSPLVLFTTLAAYCFLKSIRSEGGESVAWKLAMSLAFGLGFLTKGPAALIPAFGFFLYIFLRREVRSYFLTPWAIICFMVFCLSGLGWYYLVAREVPGAVSYFWDNQVWGRTISDRYDRNPGVMNMFLYYPPLLIAGAMPWILVPLYRAWKKRREITWFSAPRLEKMAPENLFLLCWFAGEFLILSLAQSKLILYILPLYPILAIWIAGMLVENINPVEHFRTRSFRRPIVATACWGILLIASKGIFAQSTSHKDSRAVWQEIAAHLPVDDYEIVVVQEELNGLTFYGAKEVESITTKEHPYPFFVPPEPLLAEIGELTGDDAENPHLFICRKDSRLEDVREALSKAGVTFREYPMSHGRTLVSCDPFTDEEITPGTHLGRRPK